MKPPSFPYDSRGAFTLVELLVVIAIIGILIGMLLPAVQQVREAARRIECLNKFRQCALALHNYETAHQKFPAGLNNGAWTPWYRGWGWNALILDHLELGNLADQIDFSSHNLSGINRQLIAMEIETFLCPSDPNSNRLIECCSSFSNGSSPTEDTALTNIVGIMGSNEIVNKSRTNGNGVLYYKDETRFRDIKDGSSNTLLLGEVTETPGTHPSQGSALFGFEWHNGAVQSTFEGINGPGSMPGGRDNNLDPIDNSGENRHLEYYRENGLSSWHPGGANFSIADGSSHFLSESIDKSVLDALATKRGGEANANIND
jgi:prepilin-type N-terminal cleavage/methylation domain-containing protein